MDHLNTPYPELDLIDRLLLQPCKIKLSQVQVESESQEYVASDFSLGEKNIKFRVAKITPAKVGQFVTIWKRNKKGITEPFNVSDNFSSIIIAVRTDKNFGLFIFSKEVLQTHSIISDGVSEGKRGIRVYPTWDVTTNKQAHKTQLWQTKYFIELCKNEPVDPEKVRQMLGF